VQKRIFIMLKALPLLQKWFGISYDVLAVEEAGLWLYRAGFQEEALRFLEEIPVTLKDLTTDVVKVNLVLDDGNDRENHGASRHAQSHEGQ
jgi:hypothetical protein